MTVSAVIFSFISLLNAGVPVSAGASTHIRGVAIFASAGAAVGNSSASAIVKADLQLHFQELPAGRYALENTPNTEHQSGSMKLFVAKDPGRNFAYNCAGRIARHFKGRFNVNRVSGPGPGFSGYLSGKGGLSGTMDCSPAPGHAPDFMVPDILFRGASVSCASHALARLLKAGGIHFMPSIGQAWDRAIGFGYLGLDAGSKAELIKYCSAERLQMHSAIGNFVALPAWQNTHPQFRYKTRIPGMRLCEQPENKKIPGNFAISFFEQAGHDPSPTNLVMVKGEHSRPERDAVAIYRL